MKLDNVRIKENIYPEDIAQAIEFIADSCFFNNNYNPYYQSFAEKIAIVKFFLDGIEFEENDSLLVITEVKEVKNLVNKFYADPRTKSKERDTMEIVRASAEKIIEFKKQRLIHGADAIEYIASAIGDLRSLVNDCYSVFDNISKIDFSSITKEDVKMSREIIAKLNNAGVELTAENIAKIIKDAVAFDLDKASQEIIDAKNAEIESLKKRIYVLENGA